MKLLTSLLAVFTMLPFGSFFAQEIPIPDSSKTTQKLIENLGDASYEVRQNAENKLLKKGAGVLEELREAAKNNKSPEVQYRAQRLIKQLEENNAQQKPLKRPGSIDRWQHRDLRSLFNSLFENLHDESFLDIPRHRFFHDDFFLDLEEQMESFRKKWPALPGEASSAKSSKSFSLKVLPEGVELQIEESDENGDLKKQKYLAPDMESFRTKYPEIAKKYLDGNFRSPNPRFAPGSLFDDFRRKGRLLPPNTPSQSLSKNRQILGVSVEPVSAELREFLGLRAPKGLYISSVSPNSLAEKLGIKAHDILLSVNSKAINGVADVSTALANDSQRVEVEVNRKGEKLKMDCEKNSKDTRQS